MKNLQLEVVGIVMTIMLTILSATWFMSSELSAIKTMQISQETRSVDQHKMIMAIEERQIKALLISNELSITTGILVVRVERLENDMQKIVYIDSLGTEHYVVRPIVSLYNGGG
jgi:hypothetical protein